jgi:hypothetical protein
MHLARIPLWFLLVGLVQACGADTLSAEAFCAELPPAICARIFEQGCDLPGLSRDEVRYESRAACEEAERAACEILILDPDLAFDDGAAHACVDSVRQADCEEAVRSEFHACDGVFADLARPVTGLPE